MRRSAFYAPLGWTLLLCQPALAEDEPPAQPEAEAAEVAVDPQVASEEPDQPDAPGADDEALAALRGELSTLLDELIQARTRASVLAKNLFRTQVDITLLRRADAQNLAGLKLLLDGVPVHDSDGARLGDDEVKLFEGYVAPGVHEIGVEIAEHAKEDATYRYRRSERFRIEVKKDTRAKVDIVLRDRSDMAEELPEGDEGRYDVRTELRVEPVEVEP